MPHLQTPAPLIQSQPLQNQLDKKAHESTHYECILLPLALLHRIFNGRSCHGH